MALKLAPLRVRHRAFDDGIDWRLGTDGIVVGDETTPRGSGGAPKTVKRIWETFGTLIADAAKEYEVPFELIVATIATESRGNPAAERAEPGFVSYAKTPSRVSIGLMQTLISTARSALEDASVSATDLRDPAVSIRAGTAYIAQQKKTTSFDPPKVACAYNAGGIYHQDGAGNRWKMRQFPLGTGAHADRFVAWFNDCFILFDDAKGLPAPSFVAALAP